MNRTTRRAASLLLAVALLLTPAQAVLAAEAADLPLPEEDLPAVQLRTPLGYRSQPFETGYLLRNGAQQAALRSYPRRYNLISAGQSPDVSSDLGRWNTAWAAGAIRSAEASLYQNGAYPADPLLENGLSARHLAYFTYAGWANSGDPADQTGADAFLLPQGGRQAAAGARFSAPGNLFMAAATLARWRGADYASLLPDPEPWMFDPAAPLDSALYPEYRGFAEVPEEHHFDRPYQLREARLLPRYNAAGEPDGQAVKQALLDGMAPALVLSYDPQYLSNPIDSGTAYYMDREPEQPANHVLTIVGWDDELPASSFSAEDRPLPPGPGAWLARNSWGDEQEFLWISYHSLGLSDTFAFALEPARYHHNYQYDGLGATGLMQATGAVSMANLFTATGEERLDAVGFYTADHGVTATVQIYTDFANNGDPTTGTPCLGKGQAERLAYAGYHTVALDQPVTLSAGQPFAVVVTLTGRNQLHFFVERSVEGYASASSREGQSLLQAGRGGWTDLALSGSQPANLCVKAFTTDLKPVGKSDGEKEPLTPSPMGMSSLRPLGGEEAAALALDAFEAAAAGAKSEGRAEVTAPVLLLNYTDLLPDGRDAILRAAQEVSERTGVAVSPRILADTVEDGRVLGRIYLDPATCSAPVRLGVLPADPATQAVFDGHFSNTVRTVRMMHQGPFGSPAAVALAADLVGLLTDRLVIYRFNPQTNSYRLAEDVEYSIDERGYLRLMLSQGGCYVITDRALEPKP